MVVIAQRGSATTDNATGGDKTSLTFTKPTGTVAGDVVLVLWSANGVTVTPDTGFVEVVSQIADTSNLTTKLYYKVAGGSEPASYVFTCAAGPVMGSCTAWSGADNADPIGTNFATSGGAGVAEPATTPTTNNNALAGRVFYYRSALIVSATPITFTSGLSEVFEHATTSPGNTSRSHAMYLDAADFDDGASTKAGLAITATGTETRNTYGTFTLRAAITNAASDYGAASTVANVPKGGVGAKVVEYFRQA